MIMTWAHVRTASRANASRLRAREEQLEARQRKKPELKKVLGFDFTSHILLDNRTIQPNGMIQGTLVCDNKREKVHQGIRVQLEGTVTIQVHTTGNKSELKTVTQTLILGSSDIGVGNAYSYSPIGEQVLGIPFDLEFEKTDLTLPTGTSTFSFAFQMTGDSLPAPFRKKETAVEYQIVGYIRHASYYLKMASQPVTYNGHLNLYSDPPVVRPLTHESQVEVKMSLFSSITLKVVLSVEESSFLPGEEIPFQFQLLCRKKLTIENLTVNLIRKSVYNINGVMKMGVATLDVFDAAEMETDEGQLSLIVGVLRIPRTCVPSYREKGPYNVIHLLEYGTKVAEHPNPLKGQVEVIIGTTRCNPEALLPYGDDGENQVGNSTYENNPTIRRAYSIESRLSEVSLLTLPPAYSQLSSRATSLLSLETLPPNYDDLNWNR